MDRETFEKCFYVSDGFVCLPTQAYNKYHGEHPDWMVAPEWTKPVLEKAEKGKIYCLQEAEKGVRKLHPNEEIVLIIN